MKKLDEYYFSEDIIPSSNYKEYIKRYENFKKLSLTSPMNYILVLFFTLALLTVILLNDVKNIMLIVTPIVLAFFDVLVIVPLQRRKKQEISELEEELDQSEDSLDLRLRVKNVHNKAYNYSYVDIAIRYIYASVIILTTLVTMNICQISSFPFVIFYSFISLTLYKSISLLFQYGDKIEEYRLAKIKLINFLKK